MTITFRYLVMALGMISSIASRADEPLAHADIRRLVETGEVLPLSDILEKHQTRIHGRILDLEVEHEHGRIVYEIEFMGDDGVIHEAYIDASNGDWLKEEIEH